MSQKNVGVSTYIPDSIGSKDILIENAPLIGTVEFTDGIIVFSPGFLFLFFGDLILPSFLEGLTIFIALILTILGLSLLLIKPNYMSLGEWISQIRDFREREKDLKKNLTDEDGKPFESYEAVPDDDTRRLTKVSKVYPSRGAIELDDGTMISILEFTGSNLDMASQELRMSTVDQYARAVSSQIQHDIQFYMPMRPVSLKSTRARYERMSKETDFDTSDFNDSFMDAYLDDRVDWLNGLGSSSYIREQYVIVKVNNRDVYQTQMNSTSSGSSGIDALPGGEVISDIIKGFSGESRMQSEQERKRKKLRELRNRAETIGGALSVGPGNSHSKVSAEKGVALIKEFWEGEKIPEDEMAAMNSEYPFSVMNPQGDTQ